MTEDREHRDGAVALSAAGYGMSEIGDAFEEVFGEAWDDIKGWFS